MNESQVEEVWSMLDRDHLAEIACSGPTPVFATISGAHLYGFASPDSDVDLRGAFLLPTRDMLGLSKAQETVTIEDLSTIELDWVAHDVRKFARMMVSHNGYVLEQLYSPLVVVTGPAHEELLELGKGCITRPIVRHYKGFARGRRERLRQPDATVKHLLYAYRVYLSGIYVMREGEIESNLHSLSERLPMSQVSELIDRKRQGTEKMALLPGEVATHEAYLDELERQLDQAHAESSLPLEPTTRGALEDYVIRLRLEGEPRCAHV